MSLGTCVAPVTTEDPASTGAHSGAEALADPSFLASHSVIEIAGVLGLVVLLGAGLVYASFKLPARVLLGAVLALGVVQLFGPFGFTSIALLATVALLPGVAWRWGRDTVHVWSWLLLALAIWQGIAVLWSAKLGSAAFGVIQSLALLTAFILAFAALRAGARHLNCALLMAAPFVVIESFLVIVFRFSPSAELAYLTSPIAQVLTEPGVELIGGGTFDNVMDLCKAGGTFLNGNTAGMFLAVTASVYVWAATRAAGRASWVFIAVAVLSAVATFATGSKTPLVLIVVLPALAILVLVVARWPRRGLLVAGAALFLAAGGALAASAVAPRLLEEVERTLDERFRLWGVVGDLFPTHWFTGLGFGNWRDVIADRWDNVFPGVPNQVWPPHNLYLQAWVDAGLVAVLLTLALSILPIIAVIGRARALRAQPFLSRSSLAVAAVLIGLTWVVAHGFADTTGFFGDSHTLPFVAILIAVALSGWLGLNDPNQDRMSRR